LEVKDSKVASQNVTECIYEGGLAAKCGIAFSLNRPTYQ